MSHAYLWLSRTGCCDEPGPAQNAMVRGRFWMLGAVRNNEKPGIESSEMVSLVTTGVRETFGECRKQNAAAPCANRAAAHGIQARWCQVDPCCSCNDGTPLFDRATAN